VIVFGLAHAYQGWVGVLATTVVGAVFAGLYLSTGELWIVMAAHVVLDLLGLVVRPTLARLARRA
jgi:membrane protease YdiL (CAAX protease family)